MLFPLLCHRPAAARGTLCGCLFAGLTAFAAELDESPPARAVERDAVTESAASVPSVAESEPSGRTSSIIGSRVVASSGEELGRIDDFLLNLPSARVAAVMVAPAEGLSTRNELNAVPASAFRKLDSGDFQLQVEPAEFAEAPRFPRGERPDLEDPNYLGNLYRIYRVERSPSSEVRPDNTGGTAGGRDEHGFDNVVVRRATAITGLPVRTATGEDLGTVHDVVIDLPSERIVAVAVSVAGLPGGNGAAALIPPTAFSLPAAGTELRLDMSAETLAGAPRLRAKKLVGTETELPEKEEGGK